MIKWSNDRERTTRKRKTIKVVVEGMKWGAAIKKGHGTRGILDPLLLVLFPVRLDSAELECHLRVHDTTKK